MNSKLRDEFHSAYINADRHAIKAVLQKYTPVKLIKFFSGFISSDTDIYPQVDNIRNSELWVSSPRLFNDPFDCAFNMDIDGIMYEEAIKYCEPLYGNGNVEKLLVEEHARQLVARTRFQVQEQLQERISQISSTIFISCFSEPENLTSLRMWGHYASNHSGFCAEYDFNAINHQFRKNTIPIRYCDTHPLNHNPLTAEECRAFRLQAGYTKAKEWEHEEEWRMIVDEESKSGQDGFSVAFPRPLCIYLGCRANQMLKAEIEKLCFTQNIRLFQMRMIPESFILTYEEVHKRS